MIFQIVSPLPSFVIARIASVIKYKYLCQAGLPEGHYYQDLGNGTLQARRILNKFYNPSGKDNGPSWLTFLGYT
ncbi:MAG TPA: hypothetical protein PK583_01170 [Gammaproteobacteria bacterium]|nr:hypothetical protein [Gammaproteobacteria bacterium]